MGEWQPGGRDQCLTPAFRFLSDPAVLIQAWKKAHAYIRHHNWYADSLELDISTLQLPDLLAKWSRILRPNAYRGYRSESMRLVPAPKTATWDVSDGWKPTTDKPLKLRPLAHLPIQDQTLAMACLLCFANLVETAQGRPDTNIRDASDQGMVSYGHRLVCSWKDGKARCRWGNATLYRQYFDDYQSFVQRPEIIREKHFTDSKAWAVVSADLSQFYDNIQRKVLFAKLRQLAEGNSKRIDEKFFVALERVFSWTWHPDDAALAQEHFGRAQADGLPQGLAASGFFSNVYLLDFDANIVRDFKKRFKRRQWRVIDYCRYVDDMRFVLEVPEELDTEQLKSEFNEYLEHKLQQTAPGLAANPDKTDIKRGNAEAASTPLANTMRAVVTQISGPLDVASARQALEELDGLLAASTRRREKLKIAGTGQDEALRRLLSPEPDVRNETVERFVAHRWRRVYRSLRLMSDAEGFTDSSLNVGRAFLDQQAEAFATDLIRRWIQDPANVRLLRVAMDIYPTPKHLDVVLKLLETYLQEPPGGMERKVCAYVAAELLRAGATETGFVHDDDELPCNADLDGYRDRLLAFAKATLASKHSEPWYLQQQAMLFLAVLGEELPKKCVAQAANNSYKALHDLLAGRWPQSADGDEVSLDNVMPLLLVTHRITGDTDACAALVADLMQEIDSADVRRVLLSVLVEDDVLANAVWKHLDQDEADFWRDHFVALGYMPDAEAAEQWTPDEPSAEPTPLLTVVTSLHNPLRQETSALRFLDALLREWALVPRAHRVGTLAPARIDITCTSWNRISDPAAELRPDEFRLHIRAANGPQDHRYDVPRWCSSSFRWRMEVGQILRAAILGERDYSSLHRQSPTVQAARRYRPTASSWFKRKHGLYCGRSGLGDRLLPISPWLSELLSRLLAWPGTEVGKELVSLPMTYTPRTLQKCVSDRLRHLATLYCRASTMPCYEYPVRLSDEGRRDRSFRVAVVQSVLPLLDDFTRFGAELDDSAYRRKHRRHVTSMLRLVQRTLEIREGYKEAKEKIDLVVFPELAVHKNDIGQLIRFADCVKCVVFSGLVFHPHPHQPDKVINSGVWILPTQTSEGRTIHLIEQGKKNLTEMETKLDIEPYRPCQWLITGRRAGRPWRITATICYDATDLRLASDMRDKSDAFIVSALNRDTGTFDTMAAALHYHMYQHLILANTGQFGGTTVQAPYKAPYRRVVLHHHGMDSLVVSVFDLDLFHFRSKATRQGRRERAVLSHDDERKYPPAGFCR